jgi:hypothetical protein
MGDPWLTISGELVVGHDIWAAPALAPDGDARPPQDGAPGLAGSHRLIVAFLGETPSPPRLVLLNVRASGRSSPQIDRVIAASWLIVAVSPCHKDRVLAVPSPTRVIDHR